MNGDGCIDQNDLRSTLVSLGEKVDEQAVRHMLSEVSYLKMHLIEKYYTILILIS